MSPSRSRSTELARRSAADPRMSSSARWAPRRGRLAVASTVATGPGSRRADASRQSTNDSSVTAMKPTVSMTMRCRSEPAAPPAPRWWASRLGATTTWGAPEHKALD